MRSPDDKVREQVLQVLDWEDAHVSFDQAVAGLRPASRGARPPGFDHSVWELVEHIRLAQDELGLPSLHPLAAGDLHRLLDHLMIQIGHPAFERGCHAHLFLLHQQLHQVSGHVSVAHALEQGAVMLIPVPEALGIRVARAQPLVVEKKRLL